MSDKAECEYKPPEKKGFTCECGKRHRFDVYLYSHWNERMFHTCDQCGRVHNVYRGKVTRSTKDTKWK